MEATYRTPAEFDRALKKAARKASGDAGERYRQALRDRFLCRIFSDPDARFILKGGSGTLARIPSARATRDTDFATRRKETPDAIIDAFEKLLALDLGDFCKFKLSHRDEAIDENGYSRLVRLRYATYIGEEEKDPVLVDLSLDCEATLPPERLTPANRLDLPGALVRDYYVYSVEDQLADKLCAIMEKHPGGWPSSRMKDLVDIVFYALTQSPTSDGLRDAIENECKRRSMDVPEHFAAPDEWRSGFSPFATKARTPEKYRAFDSACTLASKLFNPVLENSVTRMKWECRTTLWE